MYRTTFPNFYGKLTRAESIIDQAWYCSKKTLNKAQREEVAHIVMRQLAGTGIQFTMNRKPYNPYSRTTMGDFPKKWAAISPLLSK